MTPVAERPDARRIRLKNFEKGFQTQEIAECRMLNSSLYIQHSAFLIYHFNHCGATVREFHSLPLIRRFFRKKRHSKHFRLKKNNY
jgi:hypothetical protein